MATLAVGRVHIPLQRLRSCMSDSTVSRLHFLQPCRSQARVQCLRKVETAHTSQINWTLGTKGAWERYGLQSVKCLRPVWSEKVSRTRQNWPISHLSTRCKCSVMKHFLIAIRSRIKFLICGTWIHGCIHSFGNDHCLLCERKPPPGSSVLSVHLSFPFQSSIFSTLPHTHISSVTINLSHTSRYMRRQHNGKSLVVPARLNRL